MIGLSATWLSEISSILSPVMSDGKGYIFGVLNCVPYSSTF
jgi:hypothetical protein